MDFLKKIPTDFLYVALLFGLFVVPRILQRFRLPNAITSLGLGALAGLGFGWFHGDATVNLLSTLGIVALFLFAGLEVDFRELRAELWVLVQHVVVRLLLVWGVAWAVQRWLELPWRPAILVSLALVTPSTGFILDSIGSWGLDQRERFWIRSKAVAVEIVALAILFVTLRSDTAANLAVSSLALAGLIALLPLVFRAFAALIVPRAPKSEFAFLMMVALLCAFVTRELGVYYLVGAFLVGIVAQRFRERLPSVASDQMLTAVEAFGSLFVPFYFFHAGLEVRAEDFGVPALLTGLAFLVLIVPVRLATVVIHRRIALGEPYRKSLRVGLTMLPTLVFTLVLAGILRERFGIAPHIFGGLVVYTLVNTIIPSFVFRAPPPDFEHLDRTPVPPPIGGHGTQPGHGAA